MPISQPQAGRLSAPASGVAPYVPPLCNGVSTAYLRLYNGLAADFQRLHDGLRRAACLPVSALLCLALAGSALAAPRSPFALLGGTTRTLTGAALAAAQKTTTQGRVSPDGKTLTFGQKTIRLVVVTGPEEDMLSYRIAGRRNPTLAVPRGATLKMLFVNTDGDMFHNIRFGAVPTATPPVMTAYMESSVGTPDLAHKLGAILHGEELTLRAPLVPGAYAYLCTVRGHAQGGMAGKVIVR